MRNLKRLLILPLLLPLATGCREDSDVTYFNIQDEYTVARLTKLLIEPAIDGEIRWELRGPGGEDCGHDTGRSFLFMEGRTGVWALTMTAGGRTKEITITVVPEKTPYSPGISAVYEYCPAPGQFVNTMPQYEPGDTDADMLRKCLEAIGDDGGSLVTLGAYGGYITFGFDHTVANREGADFRIYGNATYAVDPEGKGRPGGSAEPGVVMVSYDVNCNGMPDDPWYEIEGSAHGMPGTERIFSIIYYRPFPLEPEGAATDYIRYDTPSGERGYLESNTFHTQSYWPQWSTESALAFTGTRLPANAIKGANGNWFLEAYTYGYADNHPNTEKELCAFDISRALDSDGNPVDLPGVDFIRVYTGVLQQCGWIGETSTEVAGAEDLGL